MTEDQLNCEYLEWMYQIVCDDQYTKNLSYRKLFTYLYDTEFEYTRPMDGNRYEDGIDLRYKFGRSRGIADRMIAAYLDTRPCSVLEMMIALSIRLETNIMCNEDLGDRVGQWFWEMIVNLDLGHMNDRNFDENHFENVMTIFMNHEYDRDGKGGLFRTTDRSKDMRKLDIWYQMHAYLNDVLEGKA